MAGACKAFALLPFLVLLVQMGSRPADWAAAGGAPAWPGRPPAFALICAPFVAMAPAGFFRQVVLTQLERGAPANPSLWGRVAQLLGVPPAPSMAGVPDGFERSVVVVVGALVCLALVVAWRAGRGRRRGSSLERYGVVAAVVTAAGLAWPAAFYYHYAAFLAPFLALPVGVAADGLYAVPAPGAGCGGGVGPGRGGGSFTR